MRTDLSLPPSFVAGLVARLGPAPASSARIGDSRRAKSTLARARPVHVVYGGAHLYKASTVAKLGERARIALDTWGGDEPTFGHTVGVTDPDLALRVLPSVREKLARRAVEALCIDFEDGYGLRPDAEEDAEAIRAADELAKTTADASIGIRIKALGGTTTALRAIRTLDLFVTSFAKATRGELRAGFTVTLPKVTSPEQVSALIDLLENLESALGISRRIDVELMIESARALMDGAGLAIPSLLSAARGRAVTVHLGAYDLTAELGVTAGDQRLDHPYCDVARMLIQLSVAGTDVDVSDGATTLLPIPPPQASLEEGAAAVRRAWSLHAANVRRAIELGILRGWDLHPAQLPARYGALFAYFLARKSDMTARLRSFLMHATQASRVGQVFDDAATAQGVLNFFARGVGCGALDEDDVRKTGLTLNDLSRSFVEIIGTRASSALP